tara:strand:- start:172 stop:519 length:348 start_codon:yes stop_codon:yes gene_type:complete
MDFKNVYKICTSDEWNEAKKLGKLNGSKKDINDGFIHFSDKDQLSGTLKKFFLNKSDLVLLKVDALKLRNLVYEQTSDGNIFPHLYEPLELSHVIKEYKIELNKNGTHKIPKELE